MDRATKWIAVYPKSSRSAKHTIEAMKHFAGSKDKVSNFYCDDAPELITAARARQRRFFYSNYRNATNQPRGREVRQNGKGRQQLRNRTVGIFHQMVA